MRKTIVTITLNDADLDKILPSGTPKAGVRRAKIAATVCTNIIQTMIDGVNKKEKAKVEAPKEEPAKVEKVEKVEKVKEEPKKTTTKKTATKKTSKK